MSSDRLHIFRKPHRVYFHLLFFFLLFFTALLSIYDRTLTSYGIVSLYSVFIVFDSLVSYVVVRFFVFVHSLIHCVRTIPERMKRAVDFWTTYRKWPKTKILVYSTSYASRTYMRGLPILGFVFLLFYFIFFFFYFFCCFFFWCAFLFGYVCAPRNVTSYEVKIYFINST